MRCGCASGCSTATGGPAATPDVPGRPVRPNALQRGRVQTILEHLLVAPLDGAELPDVDAWWARHRAVAVPFERPVDRAMAAALQMDRLGWAFASGYQEALRHLVPALDGSCKVALCATEEGGNHPRAIAARLVPQGDAWRLDGHKRFTTLGTHAEELLVVASEGTGDDGRNRLVVVRVPASREGVRVEAMPTLPFVPEVPHAESVFEGVRVEPGDRLEGDGYARYLKPFRTVEDLHVHAALLAWLLGCARRFDWPREHWGRLLACVVTARSLLLASPEAPAVHVALAGLLAHTEAVVHAMEPCWATATEPVRARWLRDRPLLAVAGKARSQRAEAAFERLNKIGRAEVG
jgi:acyl-CoA dehydrogenase